MTTTLSPSSTQQRTIFRPVAFTDVTIADHFWSRLITLNREVTIPIQYDQCKATGRFDALKLDWKPGDEPVPHIFWDSDVAKWLEAASYSLAAFPDTALEARVDEVIELLAGAQQPDGYLNIFFSTVAPDKRWANLRDDHELYCCGHLVEAAVAHFRATGKRSLLDIMCRYADYVEQVFGLGEGQRAGYCGHEEIELALIRLYEATGEERYLKLSKYFVDQRGVQPHYFDTEARARGEDPANFWAHTYEYNQSHLPVREQTRVTGHAVRGMYLYSAMADLALLTDDAALLSSCETIWNHLTSCQMYVTGGFGASSSNEGYGADYDLPNHTAYAETCASVGLVFWAHRMLQIQCDGRYADVMERALYNGTVSGVSLEGTHFFYDNPLASVGTHHRWAWHGCVCCPPNLSRLIASIGQYIYSSSEHSVAVHLYVAGNAQIPVSGTTVRLQQTTNYPWDGAVDIKVDVDRPSAFALKLRKPGWCRNGEVRVNNERVEPIVDKGYWTVEREWQAGDVVTVQMEMPIEAVAARPDVRADAGRVALMRGPVVYCAEQADNGALLDAVQLNDLSAYSASWEPDFLGGIVAIRGTAQREASEDWGGDLYRTDPPAPKPQAFTAIPYYAWDNREAGEMLVWLRR